MDVWMDRGGTFTDVVRVDARGRVTVEKVPSDRADLATLAAGATRVRRGTTVATNALLEGRGAKTLLLVTRGFADLVALGDGRRPDLFALDIVRTTPPCDGVLEVDGRIAADGTVLAPAAVDDAALAAHVREGFVAAAVVLVHGPLAPDEEHRLAEACRRAGFLHVSVGHAIAPSRGFLSRLQTTLVDAATTPLLPRDPGLYMRSDGGLARPEEWRGCDAILSGPAGGVVATASLVTPGAPAIGFDMGGTSTDVCRVVDSTPVRNDHLAIAGLRLRIPAVALETIAAGGGSLCWTQGGVYNIGPASAGADPGPACYGRGGPAALSDCEAVLGRLPSFPHVCGPGRDGPLDVDAARRALGALDSSRPVEEVAAGFREVASEEMARAVRSVALRHGADPAAHTLVAFGGAGPGHACGVARRVGIRKVLVPLLAGAFSAVGIGKARRRAEVVVPLGAGESLDRALAVARAHLPFAGEQSATVAARHPGTSDLLEVPYAEGDGEDALRDSFAAAHRARFGFVRDLPVAWVELRVRVEESSAAPPMQPDEVPDPPHAEARAWFDGGWRFVPHRSATSIAEIHGPAIVAVHGATVVVEPGWTARRDGHTLVLEDRAPALPPLGVALHPVHTATFGARVMAIAEQMGSTLQRLARSVNIRERLDFSCAVFDAEGHLLANAPHIPVHLGSMGETVRALLRHGAPLVPGEAWVTNDPYTGGSHLPDITVITPVGPSHGRPVAFVACRGHHVDVGGSSPGSMPSFSRSIDEEGTVLPLQRLAGSLRLGREPDVVAADLGAQEQANALGARLLLAFVTAVGPDVFSFQAGHLRAVAARAVREVLRDKAGRHEAREVFDDGHVLDVRLEVDTSGDRAVVHIHSDAHPGNLNAPIGVARAAVLYVFRALVERPLPLNEGALAPFTLEVTPAGLFDPRPPTAVVGGNVETSQRLVDALFRATGVLAAGQGTMNNLTVGTSRGAWYETIAGGAGASRRADGAGGVQVGMTNTAATDIEELEVRFPVRLVRWEIRRGSGGSGTTRGGDGVVKEWEFLETAQVSLLAGRRAAGAPGLDGGGSGAPGIDEVLRNGSIAWEPAPPSWTAAAGDRLRIQTPGGGGWSV